MKKVVYKIENKKILIDEDKTEIVRQIFDKFTKETYARAMEKSAVREYGKRSTEVIHYLRNKLKCGYCSCPITGETVTARNGSLKRYYKCSGRKHHNGCQKATVKKEQIEDMVISTIIKELSKPEILDSIVNNLLEVQEKQLVKNGVIRLLIFVNIIKMR